MSYTITFSVLHEYDLGAPGITVPVTLDSGLLSRTVEAKLDSGSSYCVFRRGIGEAIGLDIELGTPAMDLHSYRLFSHLRSRRNAFRLRFPD